MISTNRAEKKIIELALELVPDLSVNKLIDIDFEHRKINLGNLVLLLQNNLFRLEYYVYLDALTNHIQY